MEWNTWTHGNSRKFLEIPQAGRRFLLSHRRCFGVPSCDSSLRGNAQITCSSGVSTPETARVAEKPWIEGCTCDWPRDPEAGRGRGAGRPTLPMGNDECHVQYISRASIIHDASSKFDKFGVPMILSTQMSSNVTGWQLMLAADAGSWLTFVVPRESERVKQSLQSTGLQHEIILIF